MKRQAAYEGLLERGLVEEKFRPLFNAGWRKFKRLERDIGPQADLDTLAYVDAMMSELVNDDRSQFFITGLPRFGRRA